MHKRVPTAESNHKNCWVIDAACYHDGTSLWGSETVMPAFMQGGSEAVYPLLEQCYRNRFLEAA